MILNYLNCYFSTSNTFFCRFLKRNLTNKLTRRTISTPFVSSEVTAGVLIIGDEILNGKTDEENTSFLVKNLNQVNIKVKKIAILPDCVDAISEEIKLLSEQCTVVLTTGGIGPTHDDVTYEAVAKAFDDNLVTHLDLYNLYKNYFGPRSDVNPAIKKLSTIPRCAILNFGLAQDRLSKFPLISTRNIYMLPGVPMLLQRGFDIFKHNFLLKNKQTESYNIYLSLDEVSITNALNETVEKFRNRVKFGSYPVYNENYYRVKLALESTDKKFIVEACDYLQSLLPKGSIVDLKSNYLLSAEDLRSLCKSSSQVESAKSIIDRALKTYEPQETCICFNGGKDCTAMLHLIFSCVDPKEWCKIQTLYVHTGDTFKEIDYFIQSAVKRYKLNLTIIEGELRDSFASFLGDYPQIKAVFMGMRKGDPGSEDLTHFCNTDVDWPAIMRVLPILEWSYTDVWSFIRDLQLPYCVLYDRGYTSLGSKSNTSQNPALAVVKESFVFFQPAYMLKNNRDERKGRQ